MKIPPKRIAIIGAESTGKTTLAEALANALNCPWVAEFARDYWLTKNAHFSYEDMEFIAKADVLIVGGTSLVVYPAAGMIDYYRGRQLVLINRGATHSDKKAKLLIQESIGEVLGRISLA